jgi:16S rRNA (uracil1498-N3)-methyltransferase
MAQIHRLYIPRDLQTHTHVALDPQDRRMLSTVLRQKKGDPIELLNGQGQVAQGILSDFDSQQTVYVEQVHAVKPLLPHIRLVVGLLKGEKMSWLVQKATELGVNAIDMVQTKASVVKYKKAHVEKSQKTAIEALRQSGNPYLPTIRGFASLQQWHAHTPPAQTQIFFHEKENTQWLGAKVDFELNTSMDLLIGPEGGFLAEEADWLCDQAVHPMRLHPYVLRAETAALMGLSFFRAIRGQK